MSLRIRATKSLMLIKRDFRALQKVAKNMGAQEVFSSILTVIKGDVRRYYRGQDINTCLQDLCVSQSYDFFKPWKSLQGTRYVGSCQDLSALMGKRCVWA